LGGVEGRGGCELGERKSRRGGGRGIAALVVCGQGWCVIEGVGCWGGVWG